MIEEMYQQESKELEEEREREGNQTSSSTSNSFATQQQQHQHQHQHQHASTTTTTTAQNPMPAATSSASTSVLITEPKRSADTMTPLGPPSDRDPSLLSNSISRSHPQQPPHLAVPMLDHSPTGIGSQDNFADNTCHFGGSDNVGPTTMIRFGNTSGDVSLTLGLRHAGNAPEKGAAAFSVRDFAGSC